MHMIGHHLERQGMPAVPCADTIDCFSYSGVKRLSKNAHSCFGYPDKMIVDVIGRVPRLSHLRNFHFCILSKLKVVSAVNMPRISLQLPHYFPICMRSCHFFLQRIFCQKMGAARRKLPLFWSHMILAKRPEGENHNEREKSSFLPNLPKAYDIEPFLRGFSRKAGEFHSIV